MNTIAFRRTDHFRVEDSSTHFHALAEKVPSYDAHTTADAYVGSPSSFTAALFNNLLELDEVGHHENFMGKVYALGQVICKHDLQEDLGVWLVHKHFDLLEDEKLIGNIIIDDEFGESIAVNPVLHANGDGLLPHQFKLSQNEWVPMQFVQAGPQTGIIAERCDRLVASAEFLKEFTFVVDALQMQCELGIGIRFVDVLSSDPTAGSMERTHVDRRQLLHPMSHAELKKASASTTMWCFKKNPTGNPELDTVTQGCYCVEEDEDGRLVLTHTNIH